MDGVGVAQAASYLRFIAETCDELEIPRILRIHHFERADFLQADVHCLVDGTHRAASDLSDDTVLVGNHLPRYPLRAGHQPRVVGRTRSLLVRVLSAADRASLHRHRKLAIEFCSYAQ